MLDSISLSAMRSLDRNSNLRQFRIHKIGTVEGNTAISQIIADNDMPVLQKSMAVAEINAAKTQPTVEFVRNMIF